MVTFSMAFTEPSPDFQCHGIFEVEYLQKRWVRLTDIVPIAHEYETIPNISNGTMFDDLD